MDVKRKHYFKIDANTSSDTIFAILESIESDQEEDIEKLSSYYRRKMYRCSTYKKNSENS